MLASVVGTFPASWECEMWRVISLSFVWHSELQKRVLFMLADIRAKISEVRKRSEDPDSQFQLEVIDSLDELHELKEAILCSFLGVHILFLVTARADLYALMLKKLNCILIQLDTAVLFFPGFLPLSETLCFSSCPTSKGLLCSDWPVQTHTFQMNL